MMIDQKQQDNLFKAFGLFIEVFRTYVVTILYEKAGDKWPSLFLEGLYPSQKDSWNLGLVAGTSPETLIDYQFLKGFSLKFKDFLKEDFGKNINKLASRLETVYETRNKLAHFQTISKDEFDETFLHLKSIAKSIKMIDLAEELSSLHEVNKVVDYEVVNSPKGYATIIPWFNVVTPHLDIRQGRLDESVFAANLAEVALNQGREIYNNPVVFFSKTFFTAGLKNVAKMVINGLNGKEDAENRVISLQTGFGGGKTHTLISLYHLCKWGNHYVNSQYTKELFEFTGFPQFESANIAVFTNTTNDPASGRVAPDGTHIQTIWGEIAYQLGGINAYEIIRKNDEQLISPGGTFKRVLELCTPALILIDELADYCVKASARIIGNSTLSDQTISFIQELTESISGTNNCVTVVTLPASPQEVGSTPEAQSILNSLQKRVSRVGSDTQPVTDDEIYEVIRRRLFDDIGNPNTIEAVSSKYLELYQNSWAELPSHANKSEYKQRLLKAYPFHPELIDIFRIRWASHHDFQRTRGALRLLAAIVSDLWNRQNSLPGDNLLVHSGEVSFVNMDAISGQLKKLYGNGYDAVITADVAGISSNAFKIDVDKKEYGNWNLTKSIASVILMNSFGNEGANKGISIQEIKLQLLTPSGFNHNSINGSLDELESAAYYLYSAQSGKNGKRFWFHTKPNINILINQAKSDIKCEQVESQILGKIRDRVKYIQLFNVIIDPAEDVPEQLKLTLIILSPKFFSGNAKLPKDANRIIEKLSRKKGNSERVFRNTLLFLICSEIGLSTLNADINDFLACQKIFNDYQGQLEREQREEVKKRMDEAEKRSIMSLAAAYSVIAKFSEKNGIETLVVKQQAKEIIDSQINFNIIPTLKEEEWLLDSVGLAILKKNNLLPEINHSVKVFDIYEAFIRFDDKPMITGPDSISKSILKYSFEGYFCIANGESEPFMKCYLNEVVPFFDINDQSYWLIDRSLKPKDTFHQLKSGTTISVDENVDIAELSGDIPTNIDSTPEHKINSITISGKVQLDHYTELFRCFISPFVMQGYKIDIEMKFRIKTGGVNQLNENNQLYRSAKEAAKQLGLIFNEESEVL